MKLTRTSDAANFRLVGDGGGLSRKTVASVRRARRLFAPLGQLGRPRKLAPARWLLARLALGASRAHFLAVRLSAHQLRERTQHAQTGCR